MIKKIIDILDSNDVIVYSDKEKLNVDVEKTVNKLGISLKEERLERTVHGLVRKNNNNSNDPKGLEIVVHSDLPAENKKMTVAHELGHALIHFPRKRHIRNTRIPFFSRIAILRIHAKIRKPMHLPLN